jgi:hypothetical protein
MEKANSLTGETTPRTVGVRHNTDHRAEIKGEVNSRDRKRNEWKV